LLKEQQQLPFIHDAKLKLYPNKHKALSVYKKLNNNPRDKKDVIMSEGKLQSLGHVDYIKNLPVETQRMLNESSIQNFHGEQFGRRTR